MTDHRPRWHPLLRTSPCNQIRPNAAPILPGVASGFLGDPVYIQRREAQIAGEQSEWLPREINSQMLYSKHPLNFLAPAQLLHLFYFKSKNFVIPLISGLLACDGELPTIRVPVTGFPVGDARDRAAQCAPAKALSSQV